MPLVPAAHLIASAAARGGGIGAFNVITLEHAEAIVGAAAATGKPVIAQISQNCVKFHNESVTPLAAAITALATESVGQVALHLDHITDDELFRSAVHNNCSSAMYDAAHLGYQKNIAATKSAAEWAHANGIFIEAELGEIGGKDGAHAPGVSTDPDEAAEFVAATAVDALAVAVGTSHAMLHRNARVDLALVAKLKNAVPVPLVLHGSSGISDSMIREAVSAGMVKINIGTALNVAFSNSVRRHFGAPAPSTDPRKYLGAGRGAMGDIVAHFIEVIHA